MLQIVTSLLEEQHILDTSAGKQLSWGATDFLINSGVEKMNNI